MKFEKFLKEDGEGAATTGTTTGDVAKTPGQVITGKRKKKKKLKKVLEGITLDIEVGDVVLGGKFKNKKIVVKEIGTNEKGDVTINGKSIMRVRVPQKPEESDEETGEV